MQTSGLYWLVLLTCFLCPQTGAEILTPPYFNLAEGRNITASATCGEGIEGPELYCKLVGANDAHDEDVNVMKGQVRPLDFIFLRKIFLILIIFVTKISMLVYFCNAVLLIYFLLYALC